jgi:hypothetical protein
MLLTVAVALALPVKQHRLVVLAALVAMEE